MKYTPGPWHVRGTYNGRSITRTYWIAPEGPEPGTEALARLMRHNRNRVDDARLMAAAPELLEACKKAKKYLEPDLVEPGRTVFWNLVAVIAKAEGRD